MTKLLKLLTLSLVLALMLSRYPSVKAKSLYPELKLKTSSQNQVVILDINLNPGSYNISGVETYIQFDPKKLKYLDYQKKTSLSEIIPPTQEGENLVHFGLALSPNDKTGLKQETNLIQLRFKKINKNSNLGEIKTKNTIITSLSSNDNLAKKEVTLKQTSKYNFLTQFISWLTSLIKRLI